MKNLIESNINVPNILLVDDVAANLKLLGDILISEGYKIRQASSGELALKAAEKEKPDLILLDIMMSGMDGFEVCRRLKDNPGLKDIPVIFISALSDTGNIVTSLSLGGVDYINKPFKEEEVKARVRTHLQIYRLSRDLKQSVDRKDKFFRIIAHDLRGPLAGFIGLTRLMANEKRSFSDYEKKDMALSLNRSAQNTFDLLENLLQWSQMDQGITTYNPQKLLLKDIIAECVNLVAEQAREKNIALFEEIPCELHVFADINMLKTVIRNLLSNAVKFTCDEGKVTISAGSAGNNMIDISVADSGIGMSDQMLEGLFRIDVNTKRAGTNGELSTGLGLILCKEFVESHGGKIRAESVENKGSVFHFTIPCSGAND